MPDPIQPAPEQRVTVNGIRLAYFEWGTEHRGSGPTILLVHATGFHARVWDRIVKRLPGYHIVALDQRGHVRPCR